MEVVDRNIEGFDWIDTKENPQHRIVVTLLHVCQPGGRILHMTRVARSILQRRQLLPIGLILPSLHHHAILVGHRHDASQRIGVHVAHRRLGHRRMRDTEGQCNRGQPSHDPAHISSEGGGATRLVELATLTVWVAE